MDAAVQKITQEYLKHTHPERFKRLHQRARDMYDEIKGYQKVYAQRYNHHKAIVDALKDV